MRRSPHFAHAAPPKQDVQAIAAGVLCVPDLHTQLVDDTRRYIRDSSAHDVRKHENRKKLRNRKGWCGADTHLRKVDDRHNSGRGDECDQRFARTRRDEYVENNVQGATALKPILPPSGRRQPFLRRLRGVRT